ncbi:YfjI family protein [Longispora albida]|uniref:YfjI family protein n=1 Tax=Longispora albida TaxID=203523 RepID=UPI00038077A1|nr:YfjI family protein [Longispora albida]
MNAPVAALRLVASDAESGWEIPVPLGSRDRPPSFPLDVFPFWLADMVSGVSWSTQTDPAMAAALGLSVLSACVGGRVKVEVKDDWREPVNVYVAVIADPGESKSPVHAAMTQPLIDAQETLGSRVEPLIAERAALKEIADRAAEQAKTAAAKATADRRDDLTAEAVAAAMSAEAIVVPSEPKLFIDDATPEMLMALMAANGGRMAIISDEGGIFDILAGRFSAAPNLAPYLNGHSGRPIGNERLTRKGEQIAHPALTVCVMAQPSVLRKFGSNDDLDGRGLPARFLFTLPASIVGYRDTDAPAVGREVATEYAEQVSGLAVEAAGWDDIITIPLSDEAKELRRQAAAADELRLRPGGDLAELRGWARKLGGTTMRLAGLLHTARHTRDLGKHPIDGETMAAAIRLAGFFAGHYRAALHTIGTDSEDDKTAHLLNVLISKDMQHFTRREAQRRVQRHFPKAAKLVAALDNLAQLGWIRSTTDGAYELHPQAAQHRESGDTVTTALREALSAAHSPEPAVTEGGDTPVTAVTTSPAA